MYCVLNKLAAHFLYNFVQNMLYGLGTCYMYRALYRVLYHVLYRVLTHCTQHLVAHLLYKFCTKQVTRPKQFLKVTNQNLSVSIWQLWVVQNPNFTRFRYMLHVPHTDSCTQHLAAQFLHNFCINHVIWFRYMLHVPRTVPRTVQRTVPRTNSCTQHLVAQFLYNFCTKHVIWFRCMLHAPRTNSCTKHVIWFRCMLHVPRTNSCTQHQVAHFLYNTFVQSTLCDLVHSRCTKDLSVSFKKMWIVQTWNLQ